MKKRTQAQAILEYLQRGWRLTPFGALELFGCLRLGARIHELRRAGYPIMKEMAKGPKSYAVYYLKKEQDGSG